MKKLHKWGIALLIVLVFIFTIPIIIYSSINRETSTLNMEIRTETGYQYITLSNGVTHYQLIGPDSGTTIVLVHGGTIPMWTWDKQMQPLADAGFRVLRYDQFGRGLSDRPHVKYNRNFYVKQLLELLDALKIKEPVHLLGQCVGAGIVAKFSVIHPDRVYKVILSAPMNDFAKYKTLAGTAIKVSRIPVIGKFMVRTVIIPKTIERNFDYLQLCGMDVQLYDSLYRQQATYNGFEHSFYSMSINDACADCIDTYKKLGRQKREILTIWGTEDKTVPKPMIDDVVNNVKKTEFEIYENTGHQINWERTEDFNTLVMSFFKPDN